MAQEFYIRILHTLSHISYSLRPTPFWENFNFWIGLGDIVVLSITLYWLVRYTRAAETMTGNGMMPSVDVNLVYVPGEKKSYYWFSNASTIPAMVQLNIVTSSGIQHTVPPLRIPPNNPPLYPLRRTAIHYDYLAGEDINNLKMTLCVTVSSALDGSRTKQSFQKSYVFSQKDSLWNEATWFSPDPPFPV